MISINTSRWVMGWLELVTAMRARGMKLQKIASELTERGVPTKTGKSHRWTHQAVARILRRTGPVLVGHK